MTNELSKSANGSVAVAPAQQFEQNPNVPSLLTDTTASTWVAIGSLAESLGDADKALLSYDNALRHTPNNPEVLTRLANVYRSKDVFFKAAELYEQALNFNPENGDTWGLLGHCYLMLDDLQRAYAAYQRALYYMENPNVPKLWHGIGILYDRYGSLEYAEEAFVRVLELDSNFDKSNEIYFRLGIIYKHQGKLKSALECFQYILNNPPHPLTQPDVWFQIGSVLEQQKDWNSAKEAYEKVLQVNPQHAKVLQQLGCLYSQAEPVVSPVAQNGQQQPFKQDLNVALKYLLQSLEIDQSDAHSWYYLGRVHMMRGDYNAAYEAFQQAVNRDSRNPTFWCSIGVLYYQISQYRDALDAYTRAIRLNPYISEVWYDLGTLYETCNNQISDALDAYRQAERLDPGNPHIKNRLEQLMKYQQEGITQSPQPPPVHQQPRLPQGMILESTEVRQQQNPQQVQLMQGPPGQGQPYPPPHLPQQQAQVAPPAQQPAQSSGPRGFLSSHQILHLPPVQKNATSVPFDGAATSSSPGKAHVPVVAVEGTNASNSPPDEKTPQHQVDANAQPTTAQPAQTPAVDNVLTESRATANLPPVQNPSPVSNGVKHDLEDKNDSKTTKKPTNKHMRANSNEPNKASPPEIVKGNSEEVEPKNEKQINKASKNVAKASTPQSPVPSTNKEQVEEEDNEKKPSEPVEPPLRKIEEDENYDDE